MGLHKLNKKKQILTAAMNVFVEKGYENTTMDDIVKFSGMSKGALYHYFDSKKILFLELIDHWETQTFPDFYKRDKSNIKASEILKNFGLAVVNVYENKKFSFLAEIEFWALANRDKDINKKSKILYEKIIDLLEAVLKKGVRDEEFRAIDCRIAAMLFLTSFQGINWFCLFENLGVKPSEYINKSVETLIKGCRK